VDEDLRTLERIASEHPGDQAALAKLERARVRKGLGWRGEDLRSLIDLNRGAWLDTKADEPGVYRWLRHDTPIESSPEFVYVSGGEMECLSCSGSGWEVTHSLSGPERDGCNACFGKGKWPGQVTIDPFYIGRFPVTWGEYRAFCFATEGERLPCLPWEELRPEHFRHPVVRVSGQDALDYCAWSGLRLPTREEWRWAALGPQIVPSSGDQEDGSGSRSRRYPWGDDPPSPERCVWEGHPIYGRRHTAPVKERARDLIARGVAVALRRHNDLGALDDFYPARPAGQSWCGAHDMVGNVWEWCSDMMVYGGGSFWTERDPQPVVEPIDIREEIGRLIDIGFRVALSFPKTARSA